MENFLSRILLKVQLKMAVLKRKFTLYGQPYDEILFNYINGTKYPDNEEWKLMHNIISAIKCVSRDKYKTVLPCKLYRGTDYDVIANADVGQVLDFTNRFYSWSDKYNVAKEVAGDNGTILIIEGDVEGIDLRKVNNIQSEILIPPISLLVTSREYSDGMFILTVIPTSIVVVKDLIL